MTLLPGEKQAVEQVLALAEQYGYGNLIAHLKRAWAIELCKTNPGLPWNVATEFADSSAYPEKFSLEFAEQMGKAAQIRFLGSEEAKDEPGA